MFTVTPAVTWCSTGGALALYISLNSPVKLGGTFVLSSFLLAPWEYTDPTVIRNNANSPVFICHGLDDVKVNCRTC